MDDFGDFYAATKDRAYRAVLAATGHRGDAEEAVAEAYARAFDRWHRVRRHPNPIGWVIVTAMNSHRGRWRHTRREDLGDVPDTATVADTHRELSADLRRAVIALPRRQREVVALRLIADASPEETAGLLGIAVATVNVHLHRALIALRAQVRAASEEIR